MLRDIEDSTSCMLVLGVLDTTHLLSATVVGIFTRVSNLLQYPKRKFTFRGRKKVIYSELRHNMQNFLSKSPSNPLNNCVG